MDAQAGGSPHDRRDGTRPGARGARDPRLRRLMGTMRFEKWQALGNDYLILERDELPFELTPTRVRKLCESHFGLFADGVLLLSQPADPAHVADLRIFNPDGSEAELSGNGAREPHIERLSGWPQGRPGVGRDRASPVAVSPCVDRQSSVCDRGGLAERADGTGPAGDRSAYRRRRAVPQPHERLLVHGAG